jgi:glycosyltransferase involved in cell wall biosynthesis
VIRGNATDLPVSLSAFVVARSVELKPAFFVDSNRLLEQWDVPYSRQSLSGTDGALRLLIAWFEARGMRPDIFSSHASCNVECGCDFHLVRNISEAHELATRLNCTHFVFNANQQRIGERELVSTTGKGTPLYLWCQNTPDHEYLYAAYRNPLVAGIICVSNDQALRLAPNPAFAKAYVIPNCVDTDFWMPTHRSFEPNDILYVGALLPTKGFHLLSEVWPLIRNTCPDAQLTVVGSSQLYDSRSQLGAEGITEAGYERIVLAPLGGSRSSAERLGVRFRGAIDKEALRSAMEQAVCVVVNPNYYTSFETFCVSAAEAAASGKPVVGAAKGALIEVVGQNVGGLLVRDSRALRDAIVTLLSNAALAGRIAEDGRQRIVERYSIPIIQKRWDQLFSQCEATAVALHPRWDQRTEESLLTRRLLMQVCPWSALDVVRRIRRSLRRHNKTSQKLAAAPTA